MSAMMPPSQVSDLEAQVIASIPYLIGASIGFLGAALGALANWVSSYRGRREQAKGFYREKLETIATLAVQATNNQTRQCYDALSAFENRTRLESWERNELSVIETLLVFYFPKLTPAFSDWKDAVLKANLISRVASVDGIIQNKGQVELDDLIDGTSRRIENLDVASKRLFQELTAEANKQRP